MSCDNIIIRLPAQKLTPREVEVMTLIARGKTRNEISQILSISEETVKGYIKKACRKLNAANKTHATVLACMLGHPQMGEFTGPQMSCSITIIMFLARHFFFPLRALLVKKCCYL